MKNFIISSCVAFAFLLAWSLPIHALDPAPKCESGKLKEAGKYGACRLKADSKAVKKGGSPDYSKCVTKFGDKWGKIEFKAGAGVCPTEGGVADIDARITEHTDEIASCLAGGPCPIGCQLPTTGQTGCWDVNGISEPCGGTGQDGETLSGAALNYEVPGDIRGAYGTIFDLNTGLEWAMKYDSNSVLHDMDNTYSWSLAWSIIQEMNNTCANDESVNCLAGGDADCAGVGEVCGFAGYRDWRWPNIRELHSIVDFGRTSPAIDPVFDINCVPGCARDCSCTASSFYWSSTTVDSAPDFAWTVNFNSGDTFIANKNDFNFFHVRAVRGGL